MSRQSLRRLQLRVSEDMKKQTKKNRNIFIKCLGILVQPATLALTGSGAQLIAQGSIYALSDILVDSEASFPDIDTILADTEESVRLDAKLILDQFDNKRELYEDLRFETEKIAFRITRQWRDKQEGQYSDSDVEQIQLAILKYLDAVQRWQLKNTAYLQRILKDYSDRFLGLEDKVKKNEAAVQSLKEQKTISYGLQGKESYALGETYGRESYISDIQKQLEKRQVVLLYGEPGIGKTQLASYYADKCEKECNYNVIFTKYSTSIQDLVCEQFSISGFPERNTNEETIEQYYRRAIEAIRQQCNDRTLIILDNFDTKSDVHLGEFLALKCRKIITSRYKLDGIPTIEVGVLKEKEDLRKMFAFYRFGNTTDINKPEELPIIDRIFVKVEYHTYAIELIAKQMKASHLNPGEMLSKLEEGINSLSEEKIDVKGVSESAFRHICALYRIGELQEEEKYILRCLSLMGVGGVDIKLFKDWTGLKTYDGINTLHDRGWIRFDNNEETEKCLLHPLAIDVIHHTELRPNEINCEVFLLNMQKHLMNTWKRKYTENLRIERNVLAITKFFHSPDVSKLHLFSYLSCFLWQIGRFNEAIAYDKILYEKCEQTQGMNSLLTAIAARSLAGSYFNGGQEENSIQYYKKTIEIMLNISLVEGPDLALAYEKLARCYTWPYCKNLVMAEQYFNKALDIRIGVISDLQNSKSIDGRWDSIYEDYTINHAFSGLGGSLMEKGRFYQVKGDYKKALLCTKLYQIILEKYDYTNLNSFSYTYHDQAFSWYKISAEHEKNQQFDEAKAALNKAKGYIDAAVEIIHERRGNRAVDTIECEELYGDIYSSLGLYEEALKMYTVAYETSKNLVGNDSERTNRIMKKLKMGRSGLSETDQDEGFTTVQYQ